MYDTGQDCVLINGQASLCIQLTHFSWTAQRLAHLLEALLLIV